jgi:hypothetical protein
MLKITHRTTGKNAIYHTNKTYLAVGPCTGEYFATLFRCSDKLAEGATNTSDIVLEDVTAEMFSVFLDFLHSRTQTLSITTKNAVALHPSPTINWHIRE